jgi:hypothetical protein
VDAAVLQRAGPQHAQHGPVVAVQARAGPAVPAPVSPPRSPGPWEARVAAGQPGGGAPVDDHCPVAAAALLDVVFSRGCTQLLLWAAWVAPPGRGVREGPAASVAVAAAGGGLAAAAAFGAAGVAPLMRGLCSALVGGRLTQELCKQMESAWPGEGGRHMAQLQWGALDVAGPPGAGAADEGGGAVVAVESVWPLALPLLGGGEEGAAPAEGGGSGGGAEVEVVLAAGAATDVRLLVLEVAGGREVLSRTCSLQPGRQAVMLRLPWLRAGAAAATVPDAPQAAVLRLLVLAPAHASGAAEAGGGSGPCLYGAVDLLATTGGMARELRQLGGRMAVECAANAAAALAGGLAPPPASPPMGQLPMPPEVWAAHFAPVVQDLACLLVLAARRVAGSCMCGPAVPGPPPPRSPDLIPGGSALGVGARHAHAAAAHLAAFAAGQRLSTLEGLAGGLAAMGAGGAASKDRRTSGIGPGGSACHESTCL